MFRLPIIYLYLDLFGKVRQCCPEKQWVQRGMVGKLFIISFSLQIQYSKILVFRLLVSKEGILFWMKFSLIYCYLRINSVCRMLVIPSFPFSHEELLRFCYQGRHNKMSIRIKENILGFSHLQFLKFLMNYIVSAWLISVHVFVHRASNFRRTTQTFSYRTSILFCTYAIRMKITIKRSTCILRQISP